ncbi:MAG TPA: serine/threonine-protein kinase [Candidatus Obscuribacterales bacterium]
MTQTDIIGSLVDHRFRILSILGAGTFGTVYKAEQADLDRLVALKMLHAFVANEKNARARFEREVQLLSALQHENIVKVYGCGADSNNCMYLAMEYIDGRALGEVISKDGRLDWQRTCRLGMQACTALAAAHSQGVIHRDMTPGNIMLVGPSGTELVKVLDFGLSTVLPQSDLAVQRLTQTGMVVGTLLYMSPEVAMGQKADERSDVYSLGCVLYECLLGRPAFDSDDATKFMYRKQNGLPDRLSSRSQSPAMPKELEAVIFKALQRQPESRFQTAREFGEALHLVLEGRAKEIDLSGVQLDASAGSVNATSATKQVLIPLLCVLVLGLLGSLLILKPWQEPPKKTAPSKIVSPAMQDWLSDYRRAQEYVAQAQASQKQGKYSDADSRAHDAFLVIAHDYNGTIDGVRMVPAEIAILKQIAAIYDDGMPSSKVQAAPLPRVHSLYVPIFSRGMRYGNDDERFQIYKLGSVLCKIYGDPLGAARLIELDAQLQPFSARQLLHSFELIAQADITNKPSVRFYIDLAEALTLQVENKRLEARNSAEHSRRVLSQMKFATAKDRFDCLVELYKVEVILGDSAAAKQVYEGAERAALETADELSIDINGFGSNTQVAADAFHELVTFSTDPRLKARAAAQWKRLSSNAKAQSKFGSAFIQ